MNIFNIYVIADSGEGRVVRLREWDGEDELEIPLANFARDAVIAISKDSNEKNTTQ